MTNPNIKKEIEPIAVIGMSGVFPESDNIDMLWNNLVEGRDCTRTVPQDRGWKLSDYYDPKPQTRGKTYVRRGGFLRNIDRFDPFFFEITPSYATFMDPSARLFLQEAWRAIEDAGYAAKSLDGTRCGMYFCAKGDYPNRVQKFEETYLASTDTFVPARLAYHLNLLGPAVGLDTACSSTLTAVAYACDSLTLGNCDVAIVGGGSLNSTPNTLVTSSQLMLFSPSDKCSAFDESADGTVIGEAIGALVLKPLSQAKSDGDHIYGLIKGWGTNQDGRTNGLTAPSAKSQSRLQRDVYRKFSIDPEDITMVEAHGTGTKLGDPIEVQAMVESFRSFTDKSGYCALGSMKANIGHAFFGAGVASMIKVLLALQHKQIPPTINYRRINPSIKIEESPFYINTELRDWSSDNGKPRCAAINAFGATGTNTHIVLEEYVEKDSARKESRKTEPQEAFAFILSAKDEEHVELRAAQLLEYINQHLLGSRDGWEARLRDMAYTLQVGREEMPQRIGMTARTTEELAGKLERIVRGEVRDGAGSEGIYAARQPASAVSRMETEAEFLDEVDRAINARDWETLARVWALGGTVDWVQLNETEGNGAHRISMPTYPFTGDRYWIDETFSRVQTSSTTQDMLHPLLHRNASDLNRMGFESVFTGDEFFLRDHVIQGNKTLPGVAYLELVRAAAAELVGGQDQTGNAHAQIKKVVWVQPFRFQPDTQSIKVALAPKLDATDDETCLEFEVYSGDELAPGGVTLHCQGEVSLCHLDRPDRIDLQALQDECDGTVVVGSDLYPLLAASGFQLGPGHQGIDRLYAGEKVATARLRLPETVPRNFVLHPCLLDSALQTSVGLKPRGNSQASNNSVPLPFALDELTVYAPCEDTMWAVSRFSNADGSAGLQVQRHDLDLVSDTGEVCVRMRGLTSRASVKEEMSRDQSGRDVVHEKHDEGITSLLRPVYRPKEVSGVAETEKAAERYIIWCSDVDAWPTADFLELQEGVSGVIRLPVPSDVGDGSLADVYSAAAKKILNVLKNAMQRTTDNVSAKKIHIQLVLHDTTKPFCLAGLSGFLKSADAESSRVTTQMIELDEVLNPDHLNKVLKLDATAVADKCVVYRNDGRYVKEMAELSRFSNGSEELPSLDQLFRPDATYLITGGAGGLGTMLAGEICKQASGAKIVLLGRRNRDREIDRKLEDIRSDGCLAEYYAIDIRNSHDLDTLIGDLCSSGWEPNGVIHCAGILRDDYIGKKTEDQIDEVFGPKVAGTINLDHATRHCALDFFIGFSSLAGTWGNAGQADYAAANAFMDEFLQERTQRVGERLRRGKTLSIAWPLWLDGGMGVDDEYTKLMESRSGLVPLPTNAGLECLKRSLQGSDPQIAVMHTGEKRPASDPKSAPAAADHGIRPEDEQKVHAQVVEIVREVVAKLIRTDKSKINPQTEMSEFGLDSITLTKLSNALHDDFKIDISPTIFFEYSTISEFAEFLTGEYGGHIERMIEEYDEKGGSLHGDAQSRDGSNGSSGGRENEGSGGTALRVRSPFQAERERSVSEKKSRGAEEEGRGALESAQEPIAIIGMSARFPQAENCHEFWSNLFSGNDCITEIPPNRWDWREIYGPPQENGTETNIKWGGFIGDIGEWDPAFFSVSPKEAELIDPQRRLLMTYVWKAIEDSGYAPSSLWGSDTALYIGTADSGYAALYKESGLNNDGSGSPSSMGPNRMSYFLNLHGPSEPIETACSSSLVAINRGVNALREGSTGLAIAGGVQTIPTAAKHISFSQAGILCEDGRCKTFSDEANGYVRSEGVGMLVLKRLSDAERDGDSIYGVILSSAENHGGRANSLTSPNPRAQAQLIETAYRQANIDPRTLGYIETHGTGTILGDPIEINGLKSAFEKLYAATESNSVVGHEHGNARCGLGSVKTNIGHTELAAGVAGVIKTLLQMKHKTLVPSLHCEQINPHIKLEDSPFEIVTSRRPWEPIIDKFGDPIPRRAGVSSFGVGGVNAHVVLEEYV